MSDLSDKIKGMYSQRFDKQYNILVIETITLLVIFNSKIYCAIMCLDIKYPHNMMNYCHK